MFQRNTRLDKWENKNVEFQTHSKIINMVLKENEFEIGGYYAKVRKPRITNIN